MPEDGPFVLGVDIGGTKIAMAAVTPQGQMLARCSMPTEAERGFDDGVRRILSLADEVLAQAGRPRSALQAVGVGCPGPLDPARGIIGQNGLADARPSQSDGIRDGEAISPTRLTSRNNNCIPIGGLTHSIADRCKFRI